MTPRRPVLRWHGGKWKLAPWIISHFPEHRIYVEPFGGAGSVLMRKRRAYAEVWNDLDGEVVNLFRILRSERAGELVDALRLTPFAREEFAAAYEASADSVERARRLVIRSFMGFGSDSNTSSRPAGFRSSSRRAGTIASHDWAGYPTSLLTVIERLAGVVIESRDAIDVMRAHDCVDALHYVDPPYVAATRSALAKKRGRGHLVYAHEMTDDEHVAMLAALCGFAGSVVLSGYPCPLYDDHLPGWRRVECATFADGGRPRTECLWLNPACVAALDAERSSPCIFDALEAS